MTVSSCRICWRCYPSLQGEELRILREKNDGKTMEKRWKIAIFDGKDPTISTGPCSIANCNLNYQRVDFGVELDSLTTYPKFIKLIQTDSNTLGIENCPSFGRDG